MKDWRSSVAALKNLFSSWFLQACPLNPNPSGSGFKDNSQMLEDFSERFTPAIRGVVEFAKRIPGFSILCQDDQVTLLKVRKTALLFAVFTVTHMVSCFLDLPFKNVGIVCFTK